MLSAFVLPDIALIPPVQEIALAALFGLLAGLPLQLLAQRFEASIPLLALCVYTAFAAAVSYSLGGGGIAGITLLIVSLLLLVAAWIDISILRLPNLIVTLIGLVALIRTILDVGPDLPSALAGGVIGLLLLGVTGAIYQLIRRQEGLGMGDVKIAFSLGLLIGAQGILIVLLFASLLQALIGIMALLFGSGHIRQEQPFGPALCLATWFLMLFQV